MSDLLRVWWPAKDLQQPTVNPDDHYRTVHAHGLNVTWEQATPCPCRENSDLENARLGCTVCSGSGWEYETGIQTRAVVSSVQLKDMPYEMLGRWESGLAWVSTMPEQATGWRDRFTLTDCAMVVQGLFKRQLTGVKDTLRWPVVTRSLLLDNGTGVGVATDLSVLRLRKQNADGTAGALLVLGTDYVVDADGKLDWTRGDVLGTAPLHGQRYGIRYYGQPRYVVMERPFGVRNTRTGRLHGLDPVVKAVPHQVAPLPVKSLCNLDWDRRTE